MATNIPSQLLVCPKCKGKTQFNFNWAVIVNAPNAPLVSQGQCGVCNAMILAYADINGDVYRYYPPPEAWIPGEAEGVPKPIWDDFSEAVLCRSVNAFKAAAVLCRRAVQGVAIDKGVEKGTPHDQIDKMEDRRLITPLLKETAHQIRLFGNTGAHPGEDGLDIVTQDEADAALGFTEELLDHIYRLPARLAKFQQPQQENTLTEDRPPAPPRLPPPM